MTHLFLMWPEYVAVVSNMVNNPGENFFSLGEKEIINYNLLEITENSISWTPQRAWVYLNSISSIYIRRKMHQDQEHEEGDEGYAYPPCA